MYVGREDGEQELECPVQTSHLCRANGGEGDARLERIALLPCTRRAAHAIQRQSRPRVFPIRKQAQPSIQRLRELPHAFVQILQRRNRDRRRRRSQTRNIGRACRRGGGHDAIVVVHQLWNVHAQRPDGLFEAGEVEGFEHAEPGGSGVGEVGAVACCGYYLGGCVVSQQSCHRGGRVHGAEEERRTGRTDCGSNPSRIRAPRPVRNASGPACWAIVLEAATCIAHVDVLGK